MAITFTSGIPHTNGAPTHTPTAQGGKVAYDHVAKVLYKHVSGSTWEVIDLGGAGESANFTLIAGENLSSGRAVMADGGQAYYFQPTNTAHVGRMIGVTKTSATSGNLVTVQPVGVIQDAALSFGADVVLWVDVDGEITDTQSGSWSILQKAGNSLEDDKMLIDFSITILK